MEIDIESDHPDSLKVYYSNSGQFREEYSSPSFGISQRSKKTVSLGTGFANFIRIDTGVQKGTAKIYSIKALGFFTPPLNLSPPEIDSLFASSPDARIQISHEWIEVLSSGNDPYIYCKKPLFRPQYSVSFALALIFTVLTVPFLFPLHHGTSKDAIRIRGGNSENMATERFSALDGLRGLAALMVIADHTWGWFSGVGATGVWIFFALSGFLLARPFVDNPRLVLSISYMSQYIRRRMLRIVPMYYVYIFVVFAINGNRFNLALMHCLFLEGDGHLWAIPQEIIFYLLWPLAVILLFVPLRRSPKLFLFALLISFVCWNRFVGLDKIWLLGMNHIRLPLFFGIFMTGAFFSSLYSLLSSYLATTSFRHKSFVASLTSSLGFLLLLFFLLLSTGHIFGERTVYSQMYFGTYGFLAGLLILCVLLAKGHALHNFLASSPLRALGTVGFSLYLVHPLVKKMVEEFSILFFNEKIISFPLFLATLAVSYCIAKFTYLHIEKPIFQRNCLSPDSSLSEKIFPAQLPLSADGTDFTPVAEKNSSNEKATSRF